MISTALLAKGEPMSDLISRQAAIKILRESEEYDADIPNRADGVRDAIIDIMSLPTIDAIPIVRCKDCKHHINHDKRCKVWNHGVPEYGYCYEGVRKDDDNH